MAETISTIDSRFGKVVKERREAKGWTQSELAERMVSRGAPDVTQITVSRIEAGKRVVRLVEAKALAELFKLDLNLVLAEDELVRRSSVLHRDARAEFVRFRESVEGVLNYQHQLHTTLHALRDYLETVADKGVQASVEMLIKNIENYLDIDLAEDAGEIMSADHNGRAAREHTKGGQFLNRPRAPRYRRTGPDTGGDDGEHQAAP